MKKIKIILAALMICAMVPATVVGGSLSNTVNVSATIEPVLEVSLNPGSAPQTLAMSFNTASNVGARYQVSENIAQPFSPSNKAVTYTFYSL